MKYLRRIVLPFVATAFLMSLYQVSKYLLLKGEYTLLQSHIMTIVFTSLIATIVSLSMINWTERIEKRKKEVELREARLVTLQTTMYTVHHIFNNFLNLLVLIHLEAEENGKISPSTLEKLETDIKVVSEQLVELSELEDPGNSAEFGKFFPPTT